MRFPVAALFALLWALPAAAAVRVALVTDGPSRGASNVIALITAELTDDKEIELVDRESIDAVLAEQKLTLSGAVDADHMIAVGKLLKADVFAVIESANSGKKTVGIAVFDAGGALRLVDKALPEKQPAAAAQAVREAVSKRDGLKTKGTKIVGFSAVRNVSLPPDRDVFCDAVRALLERQLTAAPGIAVLERGRLDQINKERQLPTSQPVGKVLVAPVVIQLEFSRAQGDKGIRASASLSGGGEALGRFDVDVADDSPTDLADKLQDRLIAFLKLQPAVHPSGRREEGRRFARDSEAMLHSGHFAASASAAEAAFALMPWDQNRLFLSNALWARASEYLTPNLHTFFEMTRPYSDSTPPSTETLDAALGLAARALELQQASLKTKVTSLHHGDWFMDYTGGEERITLLEGFCWRLDNVAQIDPSLQPRAAAFRANAATYVRDYYRGWAKMIRGAPRDLTTYDAELAYAFQTAGVLVNSYADYVALRDDILHPWIKTYDEFWTQGGDLWDDGGSCQSDVMGSLLTLSGVWPSDKWTDFNPDAVRKSLATVAEALSHSSSPVMKMYGTVATELANPTATPASRDKALADVLHAFETVLENPGAAPTRSRRGAYFAAVDAVSMLPAGKEPRWREMLRILDIGERKRRLVPYETLKLISQSADYDTPAASAEWAAGLEKQLTLSRAPDCHILDANADGVRQELTAEIYTLRKNDPDPGSAKPVKAWQSATRLADVESLKGITQLEEGTQLIGDRVCFLGSGTQADGATFIQAFEVPLAGGNPRSLAKVSVSPLPEPGAENSHSDDGFPYRLVNGSSVDATNYYVSIRGQGVVVFPRDGSAAARIDTHHGLPSDWTQFLAATGDDLYIASTTPSAAFLIKWNLKTGTPNVRVASMRKEKKSPLDNVAGMRITFLVNDATHRRVLIGVQHQTPGVYTAWNGGWGECKAGLWQLNLADETLKQLLTVSPEVSLGAFRGLEQNSLYLATPIWVIRYDVAGHHGEYLSWKSGHISENYIRQLKLTKETPRGTGWTEPDEHHEGTRRVIDNWLWVGDPFSRISADGKTVEFLDSNLTPGDKPIGPVWTMIHAGPKQLIIGDSNQLYVLKLK